MAADPNLDLGLDYTGGITKPTIDQAGYVTRVTSDGLNVEYVPADQILFPVNSLVFATAQAQIPAVAVEPGWTVIGAFYLPSSISMALEAIGSVSDLSLNMTTRLYCVTPGAVGPVLGSEATISTTTLARTLSSVVTLTGGRLYEVQTEVVGNVGLSYFGTVRRTSPQGTAPIVESGDVTATIAASLSVLTASGVASVGVGGAVFLPGYAESLGWFRPEYLASITRKQFAYLTLG